MNREVYDNPLNRTAIVGAVRLLKRMAVDAIDPDLARLVKQVEQHVTRKEDDHVAEARDRHHGRRVREDR